MPLGARGFFMHFSASSLQYRCLLSKERGDFLLLWGIVERVWDQLCDAFGSVRDQVLGSIGDQFESGPKFMPTCVRGYAIRRPGIFYTFYFTICANLCGFRSLFAQRMCPHASRVMPLGARGFFTHFISPFV